MFILKLHRLFKIALAVVAIAVLGGILQKPTTCHASNFLQFSLKLDRGSYVVYTPNFWNISYDNYYNLEVEYPVVVYLHGANHIDEENYDAMLKDVASQSNCFIVFPRFDAATGNVGEYYGRAKSATELALLDLNGFLGTFKDKNGARIFSDVDILNIGFAGHSLGGMYALQMATDLLLVTPKMIVLHDPSGYPNGIPTVLEWNPFYYGPDPDWLSAEKLANIPDSCPLVTIVSWDAIQHELAGKSSLSQVGGGQFSGIWSAIQYRTSGNVAKHVFITGSHQTPMTRDTDPNTNQPADATYYRDPNTGNHTGPGSAYRLITANTIEHAFSDVAFVQRQPSSWLWSFAGIAD